MKNLRKHLTNFVTNNMEKYLTNSQIIKFKNWQQTISKKYYGAIGGQFGIKIIFTGVGEVGIGFDIDGNEIDLTDYELF